MISNINTIFSYVPQHQQQIPCDMHKQSYEYPQTYQDYDISNQTMSSIQNIQSFGYNIPNNNISQNTGNCTNIKIPQTYSEVPSNDINYKKSNQMPTQIVQIVQSNISNTLDQIQDTNTSSAYTKYEELPNPFTNIDLNTIISPLKNFFEDKTNWRNPFQALDNLRILNKYYPQATNNIITMFWKYILECIDNMKTHISKNVLLYLTEIFENCKTYSLSDEILTGLVPHILAKASSEKSLIKIQAEVALVHITNYCCNDTVILCLCSSCFDKNSNISEYALQTLGKIIFNIGENLPKLNFKTLSSLTNTLAKLLESAKKGNMKQWVSQICGNIFNLFGLQNYVELISTTFTPEQKPLAELLIKCVDDRKEYKVRDSMFHEFLNEKKKMVRMTQQHSFGNENIDRENQNLHQTYNQQVFNGICFQNQMVSPNQQEFQTTNFIQPPILGLSSVDPTQNQSEITINIDDNSIQQGFGIMNGFNP